MKPTSCLLLFALAAACEKGGSARDPLVSASSLGPRSERRNLPASLDSSGSEAHPADAVLSPSSRGLGPAAPASARNIDTVLLLTVDTFRADQPWTGYSGVRTPNLTRLAEGSIVYTRAYGLSNLTTASLNGMLASRYPSELVREECILGRYQIEGSLAPYLQSMSVATFGAHGHAIFARRIAPSLGFDSWMLVNRTASRKQLEGAVVGAEIADIVVKYLEKELPLGRKLFVWAHFPDPHEVYVRHREFPSGSASRRGRYDGEVAYTDQAIGRVLDTVERLGASGRTAILISGDHGEAFGEHGRFGHAATLFEEEIRVPLLLHMPGLEHRTIDVPRSLIDIAPTVAALLGLKTPSRWRGGSLLSDLSGTAELRPVVVDVPELKGRIQNRAVILGDYKVVVSETGSTVFDLRNDPQERAPIALGSEATQSALESAKRELSGIVATKPVACGMLGGSAPEQADGP